MAKISPVSIKYMVHAKFDVEGALEKPDVIGAIFGQTEGLLGNDLEMRDLQKEGKIGRIEVELEKKDRRTVGVIKIPSALDQSETTLIAAAIETIERIGPCDSQIDVEKIEDIRGSKRDYIVERAKKLMKEVEGFRDSREISDEIREAAKTFDIEEYGDEKLPSGDISGNEVIVVEGRADVINLMKNGVKNVIAMNGTKLPETIKELSKEKDITLFVDGDRGGKLIIQNVVDNVRVKNIVAAPDGKEVEELTGKEVLMALRKKIPVEVFLRESSGPSVQESEFKLNEQDKEKIKEMFNNNVGKGKAILLDSDLNEINSVPVTGLEISLKKSKENLKVVIIDGTVTKTIINAAEESGCEIIAAKNFATTETNMKLLSF